MTTDFPVGPFIVPPFRETQGGVDFLGLRQVNLDLMVQCLPGINNVTWFLRPFSVLSWIYWKFHQLAEAEGLANPKAKDLRVFREKIEVLFTWSHKLNEYSGIPGITAKAIHEGNSLVPLTFAEWKRDQDSTSLMAAIQYGPPAKTTGGLGFLDPRQPPFFRTCNQGVLLAKALDQSIQQLPLEGRDLLERLGSGSTSAEYAKQLLPVWSIETPSELEKTAFRNALFSKESIGEKDDKGRRSETIALIMNALSNHPMPLTASEIREALTFSATPTGGRFEVADRLIPARDRWLVLQLRQAQRLALESIFSWVEGQILDARAINGDELAHLAHERVAADPGSAWLTESVGNSYGLFSSRIASIPLWRELALIEEDLSIFKLMDALRQTIAGDHAKTISLALQLLFLVNRIVDLIKGDNDLSKLLRHGGPQRVSLWHWHETVNRCQDDTILAFLRFLVENYVLSQHFAVATSRYDGKSQRLRITIEEEGLAALSTDPWRPRISEDRLDTALSLMAECDLIAYSDEHKGYYAP